MRKIFSFITVIILVVVAFNKYNEVINERAKKPPEDEKWEKY